jgi:hypothetical protein
VNEADDHLVADQRGQHRPVPGDSDSGREARARRSTATPYDGVLPVDHSCTSYGPGHQPHFIQCRKSWEDGQPLFDVTVVVHDDGRVDLHGEDLDVAMWNHDPARLQCAADSWGLAVWKPRLHVLSVPGEFGYVFSLAPAEDHPPCVSAAGTTNPDHLIPAVGTPSNCAPPRVTARYAAGRPRP